MCKKCPKNLTATVPFYGDRTGTVRIWRFSHRTAPVTPNRSICDWGISSQALGKVRRHLVVAALPDGPVCRVTFNS